MGEDKLEFPSDEWVEKYVEVVNSSKAYEDAAHDWEGDFIFVVTPDGEHVKEPMRLYIDLWHGKCRAARMATPDDDAEFTYEGPLKNWKLLFDKKIDPIKGLMQRKFKLGKGDMGKIMRYTKAAMELVNATTLVPTKWPDE